MKKLIVVILAPLYISASAGATLHLHYCMGVLAEWGLHHNESKKCSKCGMEEKKDNGCCKHEQKFFRNDKDQKTPESAFQLLPLINIAIPPSFVEMAFNDFPSKASVNPISHDPPRSNNIAVYIRNCVFLI